ncbi:E3 ubiquitin-protein ligase MPSR1-like [Cornus florida]|uniref:E3 ubiquitin-protein ligase MPSR1-like n=1 Tax=Cornus florida TaxID=4283 RepID=UPI00289B44C3|nr:E3 ubiquitin-protein ligase MPSR1-like [Cornus florida]
MSSPEPEMFSESLSSLEETVRARYPELSEYAPLILMFTLSAPSQDDDTESSEIRRMIVINDPASESMIVIEGSGHLESFFRRLSNKDGPLPASKASIEAMPAVNITEGEGGSQCAICLAEYEVGGEAKEMPCKHRYHSGCIEKWLGIHGSCPVCRYKMPVEEEEDDSGKGGDGDDEGRRRRRGVDGEIRIGLFVGGGDGRTSGTGPANGSDNGDDGSSTQDLDIDNHC